MGSQYYSYIFLYNLFQLYIYVQHYAAYVSLTTSYEPRHD